MRASNLRVYIQGGESPDVSEPTSFDILTAEAMLADREMVPVQCPLLLCLSGPVSFDLACLLTTVCGNPAGAAGLCLLA